MKGNVSTIWEERFGWFWYGGNTVYNWTDKDFDNAARNFHDAGYTSVILFGTHFRFSYWAYWEDIENTIAKITKAFHKYGIKVIEHHSTHLTYRMEDESDCQEFLHKRPDDNIFPNFLETSQANPVLNGTHMDDFGQIDGSTGKIGLSSYIHTDGKNVDWIFKHYSGNAHCFNHPAFYTTYMEHIGRIIKKAGIDGIMNDDVQWFAAGNACTCKYCRELFHKETGYTLPDPENWSSFYENYDDPAYVAWKRFKKKSSGDFHRRLDKFYKELDFHPLRPAYCAEVLPFDTTCYGFESALDLWDVIFQECCGLIKYSYLCFAIEAVNRYALAERHGVPSMALFYPATQDSTYFAWALARSWGGLYTGTMTNNVPLDKPYRAFEKKHETLYREPKKISDLAFYFSKETRDYTSKNAPQKYMKPYMSYMEAALVSGLLSDMVFPEDSLDELSKHSVIVLPYIIMTSDDEISKLKDYVTKGGKIIILGEFSTKKPDISKRSQNDAVRILGLSASIEDKEYSGGGKLEYNEQTANFNKVTSKVQVTPNHAEPILFGDNGEVLGVREQLGHGEVVWLPCDIGDNDFQPPIWQNQKAPETDAPGSMIDSLRTNGGTVLNCLVDRKAIQISKEDVIGTLFEVKGDLVAHLVNTADLLPEKDTKVLKTDKIVQFSEDGTKLDSFRMDITVQNLGRVQKIKLYSPEFEGERNPEFTKAGDELSIEIPEGLFSGYLLVHVVMEK